MVSFSSVFGLAYAGYSSPAKCYPVFFAVLFLTCGAATLNSYQERKHDGYMERTRLRPLVLNKLPPGYALAQASVLSLIGLFWLSFIEPKSFLTGLAGLILYNFVYTRLKGITILAIVPGAISGAVPPYIGWLAGGGEIMSLRAFLPVVIMIFWQIPHFFLVLINHKSDYINNQSPSILRSLSEDSLRRITLPWVAGLTTTMFTFAILPPLIGIPGRVAIIGNGILLFAIFFFELLTRDEPRYKFLFQYLNVSILILMLIVCLNSGVLW